MDITKLWSDLTKMGEHSRLEVKNISGIGNDVMQTVCAYANTPHSNGGYILLGIAEMSSHENRYEIVGVVNPDKIQKDISTQCSSKFNCVIRPEIQTEVINGKVVVGIYVPESNPADKPVYIKKQGMEKGSYIRIGSTDQVCTHELLLQMIQDRNGRPYDETCLAETDLSDIDTNALAIYRELRREKNANAPELRYSDEDLLYSLHCANKVDGVYRPTIAGLILFGTGAVLRRYFSMMRFDYVRVKGREWGGNKGDDAYYSIELREPLMTLLPKAEAAIMGDIEREFSFPDGSLTREEKPVIPYEAVRELLVNAVMHRDYRVASPTLVLRFADRIEFRNYGYSLKPMGDLGTPGSKTRNETIASVLNETMYAENKGSGIAKVKRLMQEAQLQPPQFVSSELNNTFLATLSLHQLLDEDSLAWLRQFKEYALSSDEARILAWTRENTSISNEDCRRLTGQDTIRASNLLTRLRATGILEQHSHGSATYYTIRPGFLTGDSLPLKCDNNQESGLCHQSETGRNHIAGKNNQESGLCHQSETGRNHIAGKNNQESGLCHQSGEECRCNMRDKLLSSLPSSLQKEIMESGQRVTPEKRDELVIKVCSLRPFKLSELALIFNRRKEWAKKVAKELILAGKIAMSFPDDPRNKNQTYYSIQKK